MIYYFLPDSAIFGGVKVACKFVEMLSAEGVAAAVVTPDGRAPDWFPNRAPILAEVEAHASFGRDDIAMITWPPDHERRRTLPGRLVCHCQGTDSRMNAIFADRDVAILTCWRQATEVARGFGREPIEVGISIPDVFMFRGGRKDDDLAAYMPRRGMPVIRAAMRAAPGLDWTPIDGRTEQEVAAILLRAGIFIASAENEEFGLPALEAMAAACVLVSVPTKGGAEYLEDGWNAIVADPRELAQRLARIIAPENATARSLLRARAVASACRYREALQRRRLRELLKGPLSWLRT